MRENILGMDISIYLVTKFIVWNRGMALTIGVELNKEELKEVTGGITMEDEEWVCPKCGYVIYLTHYNANFGVQEHLETHGFVGYGVDYGED